MEMYRYDGKPIVCSFCLNRMKYNSARPFIQLFRNKYYVPCDFCEEIIDGIIVDIFGKGYEEKSSTYCVKYVNLDNFYFYDKIVIRSEEYKLYVELLKALCIWNKVKL